MGGDMITLTAVVMGLGIPVGLLYTFYCVRKLRTDEPLAALARGVQIPAEPELSQAARSRRYGILLVTGALGSIIALGLIARIAGEPDTWTARAFGIIPLAVGIGFSLDATLLRRDVQASS